MPAQTRDGYPIRMGPKAMPGPNDTYVAYGRGWATVSNTPFREYKHWVHEGGISTPLIAHWPPGSPPAANFVNSLANCPTSRRLVSTWPGANADGPPLEGTSLRPAFDDKPVSRVGLFWEHEGNRAIRVGDWKLVSKYGKPWELFDLTTDRVEANDVASANPDVVKELAAKWEAWAKRTNVADWNEVQKKKK